MYYNHGYENENVINTTSSITTDVYSINSSTDHNSKPESTNSIETIHNYIENDYSDNHLEDPIIVVVAEKNEDLIANGIMVEKKNVNNNSMMNGWCKSTDDLYYYYENGKRIKQLDRVSGNKWCESDLTNMGNYEIGEYDNNLKRNGVFRKYVNSRIREENIYKNGIFIRKYKSFSDDMMRVYDENGDLIYNGSYVFNDKLGYIRDYKRKNKSHNRQGRTTDNSNTNEDNIYISINKYLLIWSEVFFAILFLITCWIYCHIEGYTVDIYSHLIMSSIVMLFVALINQLRSYTTGSVFNLLGAICIIPYIISIFTSLFNLLFCRIIIDYIIVICIILAFGFCFYVENRLSVKINLCYSIFSSIENHEFREWYLIQFIIGIIIAYHCIFMFGEWYYHWYGLFMIIDSGMYFIISFLELFDVKGKTYKTGVYLGFSWGIISFVISFIMSLCSQFLVSVLLTFYTWLIIISSYFMYSNISYYSICFKTFIYSNSLLLLFE